MIGSRFHPYWLGSSGSDKEGGEPSKRDSGRGRNRGRRSRSFGGKEEIYSPIYIGKILYKHCILV